MPWTVCAIHWNIFHIDKPVQLSRKRHRGWIRMTRWRTTLTYCTVKLCQVILLTTIRWEEAWISYTCVDGFSLCMTVEFFFLNSMQIIVYILRYGFQGWLNDYLVQLGKKILWFDMISSPLQLRNHLCLSLVCRTTKKSKAIITIRRSWHWWSPSRSTTTMCSIPCCHTQPAAMSLCTRKARQLNQSFSALVNP